MKNLLDLLIKNNIVCRELNPVELKTRKKIKAFLGVNIKNEYCFILKIDKKSKILKKDLEEILLLMPEINFKYKKKILITEAEICPKTLKSLKSWRIL